MRRRLLCLPLHVLRQMLPRERLGAVLTGDQVRPVLTTKTPWDIPAGLRAFGGAFGLFLRGSTCKARPYGPEALDMESKGTKMGGGVGVISSQLPSWPFNLWAFLGLGGREFGAPLHAHLAGGVAQGVESIESGWRVLQLWDLCRRSSVSRMFKKKKKEANHFCCKIVLRCSSCLFSLLFCGFAHCWDPLLV